MEILELPQYKTELARYASVLPVCGISKEEAKDFFINFDKKEFDNPRRQIKKPMFLDFYNNMDAMLKKAAFFEELGEEDVTLILKLLSAALPDAMLEEEDDFNVMLTVSIGNSQGYPYDNNIVFDVATFDAFPDKDSLVHVLAHEIHHVFFNSLVPEEISSQQLFALNFAFEGLAMHFCNNAETKLKPKKYPELAQYTTCEADFALYDSEFDQLFDEFKQLLYSSVSMSQEEVYKLIADKYERFGYISRIDGSSHSIMQYPTYYLSCFFWGSIDLSLGKAALIATLNEPALFITNYNEAAGRLGYAARYRL